MNSFSKGYISSEKQGFTLIEVLIVMAIVALMASVVIIAINPARQFAQTRNTQRWVSVNSILNSIHQNMVDNNGVFTCAAGAIPVAETNMSFDDGDVGTTEYDICDCLVPLYLPAMPYDPVTGSYTDCAGYDSGYSILQDFATGRVTITAPSAELGTTISVSR